MECLYRDIIISIAKNLTFNDILNFSIINKETFHTV